MMKSRIRKRAVVINGRKTSVSVEDAFWEPLKEIATARRTSVANVISLIEAHLQPPRLAQREQMLYARRDLKMARSAYAYVRGSTLKFHEWLDQHGSTGLPDGPAVWICGDCHAGNLGPVADAKGRVEIQIRDLDQTVIGNPAHDLIRLGLSLATASRGSNLSGVITAKIMEQMIEGYGEALSRKDDEPAKRPETIRLAMKRAIRRSWKQLARDRIEDSKPTIPLGHSFWRLSRTEGTELKRLFKQADVRALATMLRSRKHDAAVKLLDAAYWVKGCSSLGRLRFAAVLSVGKNSKSNLCLMDVKEAVAAGAPRYDKSPMPRNNAARVVEGARHLSPFLGERMLSAEVCERSVFLRELLPQDLKLDIDQLTEAEAMKAARFLAAVVGKAHARQMGQETRGAWKKELDRRLSKSVDAPSWLWSSVVSLIASHETVYLEHCRKLSSTSEDGLGRRV